MPHLKADASASDFLVSRRSALALGVAGLTASGLATQPAVANREARATGKSVILLWMSGGPSQLDTWDPKPLRPVENRGPFSTIATSVPSIRVCEHLPLQAAMMDRFTVVRSVDCSHGEHSPNKVFQTGNRDAKPRSSKRGELYPAIGSIVAKFHGSNQPGMPPYVAFNRDPAHVARGGFLGMQFDPMNGHRAAGLPEYRGFGRLKDSAKELSEAGRFDLPAGLDRNRLLSRDSLLRGLNRFPTQADATGVLAARDAFQQRAIDMVLGGRASAAFDLSREPADRRRRYGEQLWCQQALLATRLIEAGTSFVTVDLTMGINAGDWDSHGTEHVFGGIESGLKPLLPTFDHLITTLVSDLESRGMLDNVLVLALGDFGRTPVIGTQGGFTGGRNHWKGVASMCLAGGGFRHGQVIGSSDNAGGTINSRPVKPSDIAATIYHHMGIPLDTTYLDNGGRPNHIVDGPGEPIREVLHRG
jgi:hypothetical protein